MAREYAIEPYEADVPLRIDYARELNEQQYAAVSAPDGPALVIAGAGSGKTRTLTYRVAWLIEHGVRPERILLLTFTNKAAREMMSRVAALLGAEYPQLWGGTYHSIGCRVLRRHADRLGYRSDFTIADRDDAKDLLDACIADLNIDVTSKLFPKPEVLADIYSLATNCSKSVAEVLNSDYPNFVSWLEEIGRVRERYVERKRQVGLMDFDDLLVLWLRLLRENRDILEMYQRRFQHVLVDEYQDTNRVQAELVDLLGARTQNIMAVGDDSQSIYSWRGADFLNIIEFPKRHAGARIFPIEVNYRSTPEILALANAAIQANPVQYHKELKSARTSGTKPAMVVCQDASEQAAFVAQRALQLRDEGISLDQMCILYRSHFHALEVQLELAKRNIPYLITSGLRLFEQAHMKDVSAYIRWMSNPLDEIAFKRLVRMLPGVGGKMAEKVWARFASMVPPAPATWARTVAVETAIPDNLDDTPWDDGKLEAGVGEARAGEGVVLLAPLMERVTASMPKKSVALWRRMMGTIGDCQTAEHCRSVAAKIQRILSGEYGEYLMAAYENGRTRLEELNQLAQWAERFSSATEFLSQFALMSTAEAEGVQPESGETDRIRMSTVHQAKGLEYEVVFLIMLCDGLFPSKRSVEEASAVEEERRLFYVALTRAKAELYLCYPLMRFLGGGGGVQWQEASRFLGDLPPSLIEEWVLTTASRASGSASGSVRARGEKARSTSEWEADPDPAPDIDPDREGEGESGDDEEGSRPF